MRRRGETGTKFSFPLSIWRQHHLFPFSLCFQNNIEIKGQLGNVSINTSNFAFASLNSEKSNRILQLVAKKSKTSEAERCRKKPGNKAELLEFSLFETVPSLEEVKQKI